MRRILRIGVCNKNHLNVHNGLMGLSSHPEIRRIKRHRGNIGRIRERKNKVYELKIQNSKNFIRHERDRIKESVSD